MSPRGPPLHRLSPPPPRKRTLARVVFVKYLSQWATLVTREGHGLLFFMLHTCDHFIVECSYVFLLFQAYRGQWLAWVHGAHTHTPGHTRRYTVEHVGAAETGVHTTPARRRHSQALGGAAWASRHASTSAKGSSPPKMSNALPIVKLTRPPPTR